jgi:hypothetical protein
MVDIEKAKLILASYTDNQAIVVAQTSGAKVVVLECRMDSRLMADE